MFFCKLCIFADFERVFFPCRMWQRWRANLCWVSSWERRRTDPLRSCSSSCITKTHCSTSSKLTTSPRHRGDKRHSDKQSSNVVILEIFVCICGNYMKQVFDSSVVVNTVNIQRAGNELISCCIFTANKHILKHSVCPNLKLKSSLCSV